MPEHHATEIVTFIAVCIFNEDFIPVLEMLTLMGTKDGPEAHAFAVKCDNIWIERSEIRASDASKEARTARLKERTSKKAFF
ncbi:hypothetical protein TNIN_112321 [Trichonephila inaurata madagascariensis]|uniref:Uncharacterized protein n=1 Tax=Trichonephila inaurata madagascariensis TaxID=2747483 RepID=A0A8X6WZ22_9ARAC|nr:hypothetical protein TNIN_112321 [Trichonephila inaurata madagascariensis]